MTQRDARPAIVIVLLAAAILTSAAQQPPAQRADRTVTEGVTAVLVDAVVRDKRGQPVRDLTPSDFEVLEDGVPQTIGSFTPVFADAPAAAPAHVPAVPAATSAGSGVVASPPVNAGPGVTALVFDRLSPEARRLAI
ncbi:MAG: hypothetical protein ABJC89_15985, partial [Acidobacteriota bacterium]